MAIYIVTDSTADFRPEEAQRRGVRVVPLKVQFGEEAFPDMLDHAGFFQQLAGAKELPTTSQANPDDFLPHFRRAQEAGDSLICLPMASSLSGTCQSALIAKELCGGGDVHVVDSTQTTLGLRLLVDLACRLRDQGLDAAAIASELERAKGRVRLLAIVDTLKYLHKGGRLPAAVSIAGELLKVKPLIGYKNAGLISDGIAQGRKKSLAKVRELFFRHIQREGIDLNRYRIATGFGLDREEHAAFAESVYDGLLELGFDRPEVKCPYQIGVTIGVHTGPTPIGVGLIQKAG